MDKNTILYTCKIPGRPRILKNNKKICKTRKRTFLKPSDRYSRWADFAKIFIVREKKFPTINFPVQCIFKIYYKNHQHEQDLTNAIQGLEDLLWRTGVIADDSLIYSLDGSRKIFGEEIERIEIEIKKFIS